MANVCGGQGHTCCQDERFEPREGDVMAHDPVCGKKLDCQSKGVRELKWKDAVFFFCSTKCMTDFINNPKKYTGKKGFLGFLRRPWN